jgi:hypothetical protein
LPQVRHLEGDPHFDLFGPDLEPNGWEWEAATPAQRAEFWRLAAVRYGTAWDAQMASGLGVDGRPLRPVKPRREMPRPDTKPGKRFTDEQAARFGRDIRRQDGPPLTPHRLASRARRWARMKPIENGVRGYWIKGAGKLPWGEIMGYHATGMAGTGVKGQVTGIIRDLVGLSPRFLAQARQQSVADWQRTVGDSIRRMSATMLTRLALLKEELADLFDAEAAETESTTPDFARIERIRRRREQVGQMIYRLEMDPLIRGRQGSSSRGWNFAGGSRRTAGGGQQQQRPSTAPRVRFTPLRPGETKILIQRSTRDQLRGG